MTLTINTRPVKEIVEFNLSKWNAAFNPILYDGVRRDHVVTVISRGTVSSILVVVNIPTNEVPSPGDTVFISSGGYNLSAKVINATETLLGLETPFISTATGGYVNLNQTRANYHVELELFKIVSSSYVLIAKSVFRPRPDGTFQFDLKSLLKQNIKFINDYDYTVINERDLDVSGGFNFRLREVWQGSDEPFSDFDEKDVTYFVGAAKQLRDKFGTNLGEHVPILGSIGLLNGTFDISDTTLDRWSKIRFGIGTVTQISAGILIYSSPDDAGFTEWTSDTVLTDTVEYEVVVDKIHVLKAEIKIIAGTNEVTLNSLPRRQKILITANGPEFKIRINSTSGGGAPHEAQIEEVQVFLADNPQPAKFLVEDFEPTIFKDFPFDLPFIHSDNLANLELTRNREFFDLNGATIGAVSVDDLDVMTNEFAVNRMIIGVFPAGTKSLDVWLETGEAIATGYIELGHIGGPGLETYTSGTQTDNPTSNPPLPGVAATIK